jgi:hypothetical protein
MRAGIPGHLPERLAISLWDFSWYTRAGRGEPFEDLDRAFDEAVDRGYNAVRICAAPLLLFGELGLPDEIGISGFGTTPTGELIGEGTRWYDVPGGYAIDLRRRLIDLFESARRHHCVVILSSWEYQQSASFASDDRWWRSLDAVPYANRMDILAAASIRLVDSLKQHGLEDAIAFVELHNEVDFSLLPQDPLAIDRAVTSFSRAHPEILATVSYGKPPHLDMASLPESLQVGQFHIYAYGVLEALQQATRIRESGDADFPNDELRALLRPDAPEWTLSDRPAPWRFEATVVTDRMLYSYDHVDPVAWDRWLYERYALYRDGMQREIESRIVAAAAWARRQGVPLVFAEGWVGYTPLRAGFEEGPVGTGLAEQGIRTAIAAGAWGAVPSSNAAPHHPMWADVAWQRRATSLIRGS